MSDYSNYGAEERANSNAHAYNELSAKFFKLADESNKLIATAKELQAQVEEKDIIIAQLRQAIKDKEQLVAEWAASQKAMKALAQALRDEGATHPDTDAHPIANSKEKQDDVFNKAYRKAEAELKNA